MALPIDVGTVGRLGARLSQSGSLTVRKRRLGLLGIDPSGIRRVEVAIERRVGPRRANRCRFAGQRGLGRPRHCSRRVWRRVRASGDLGRLVRRLRPARYQLRTRAVDGLGNRTKRARLVRLRLRR